MQRVYQMRMLIPSAHRVLGYLTLPDEIPVKLLSALGPMPAMPVFQDFVSTVANAIDIPIPVEPIPIPVTSSASTPLRQPHSGPMESRSPRAIRGAHVSVVTQVAPRPPCRQRTRGPVLPLSEYQLLPPPAYETVLRPARRFATNRPPPSYTEAMTWVSSKVDPMSPELDLSSAAVRGPIIWPTVTADEIAHRPYSLLTAIPAGCEDSDIDDEYLEQWL